MAITLQEGRDLFIQEWGLLGSKWGINRTMAQIHALLLISAHSLSADEVMGALNISRGNANMNLRNLINWGLIKKEHKPGERKEFFYAEKDIWKVAKRIIIERKKREIEPISRVLVELKEIEGQSEDAVAFKKMVDDLQAFVQTTDNVTDKLLEVDKSWILNSLVKILSAWK